MRTPTFSHKDFAVEDYANLAGNLKSRLYPALIDKRFEVYSNDNIEYRSQLFTQDLLESVGWRKKLGDLIKRVRIENPLISLSIRKGYRGNGLWEMVKGRLGSVLGVVVLAINHGGGRLGALQRSSSSLSMHTQANGLLKLIEGPFGLHSLHNYTIGLSRPIRWVKIASNSFWVYSNRDEPCYIRRKASGSDVVFLILYVDDILIMGNNIPKLKEVKDYLGKCFSVKDLGEAAYILGIKIYRDRSLRLIGLNQSAYIDKILKKFNMQNSKKGFIPMEVKHDLSNEMCASSDEEKAYMKRVPYASAVGSIMYAVRCTRPDVAFAQNLVSRYQQNPGKLHWVAVKHILKYLRNTKDMFLVYGGNPDTELDVTGFCDASWQCDKDDTKSQTGYVFVVNGGAVDWKSKKQTTIAMHATQSEYMAASEAAMEAVWIRKFVEDLGVMPSISKPINMYCDNSAAIIFANEPGVMKGARHFLRRYHYVREQVESGEIKLIKVHTDKNLADAFTKALPRGKVSEHANGIGLRLASSFMHICD
ncbi:retrotransposon protein, putative, ty1-copia subclass [Tanacetum coccineum]